MNKLIKRFYCLNKQKNRQKKSLNTKILTKKLQRKKNPNKKKMKKVLLVQDEPVVITEETIIQAAEEIPEVPAENPLPEIESVTQRNTVLDAGLITPIDVSENIKLESYVNKTIVNDNNVVDVPVYQTNDKMLEEVKKMISEPPAESTTNNDVSVETTTLHQITETTTESTTVHIVETTKSSIVPVATTSVPEAETIFVPIITNNNENIINYDMKVPDIDITTTDNSQRVSFWTDFINGNETTR